MIMRCPNCGNAGLVQQPYGLKCAFCGYLDERDIQRAGSRDDAAITRRRRRHIPRSAG